ncbi:MAG: isochorismatase family protein [Actinomycetota bacterium]|nr:isochorismatase family protein [Actinomycetota bacterium]
MVLRKTEVDGFAGTDLESLLRDKGVSHLSVCGVNSEMCVAATARGALRRRFEVTMARGAHATYPVPDHGPCAPPVAAPWCHEGTVALGDQQVGRLSE